MISSFYWYISLPSWQLIKWFNLSSDRCGSNHFWPFRHFGVNFIYCTVVSNTESIYACGQTGNRTSASSFSHLLTGCMSWHFRWRLLLTDKGNMKWRKESTFTSHLQIIFVLNELGVHLSWALTGDQVVTRIIYMAPLWFVAHSAVFIHGHSVIVARGPLLFYSKFQFLNHFPYRIFAVDQWNCKHSSTFPRLYRYEIQTMG